MSGEIVDVVYWEALFPNNFTPDVTYYIHNSAEAIEGLPANEISGPLGAIVWTGSTLVFDSAQASAILNAASNDGFMASDFLVAASNGGQVMLTDNAAAVLALSLSEIQSLESIGFNSISIADTAGNIEKLDASDIQTLAASGVNTITITSTNTSVALGADLIVALQKAAINLVVPTSDTVTLSYTAAQILTLDPNAIAALASFGVTGIDITSTDTLVELSAAQAIALANAAIKITAPTNDTVAVADTATNLQGLDPTVIADLPNLGVTTLIVNDDVRPLFDPAQEAALVDAGVVFNEPMGGALLSVSDLISSGGPPGGFMPGVAYDLTASPADFENNILTAGVISNIPQQVFLIPISANGSITLSVAQAEALENASLPIAVPNGDTITVVNSAGALEGMSDDQLAALQFIDVTDIAASDTPAVFSADQMNALEAASIPVVAPPNDPSQNDGTSIISGPSGSGMTFDITWDPSVASAPADYKADIEQAFQFYADTYSNPITLYYDVGFGERDNGNIGPGDLGESYTPTEPESYATLYSLLTSNATSNAQKAAAASLSATDPTDGANLYVSDAEALALGFIGLPAVSAANPDGWIGFFSQGGTFDYSSNPDQVPPTNEDDFLGVVEHEISEVMGRASPVGDVSGGEKASGNYAPIDLFRYTETSGGTPERNFTPFGYPSYFSIDDGGTNLGDWNNFTTGDTGDLADWEEIIPPGSQTYTPDSYNDGSDSGVVNPITSSDITLMNVLGYDLAAPTETPTLPPLLNVLFFDGEDANGNNALWVSGGTAAGTLELVGVNGIASDTVTASGITVFGNDVLFNGADLYGNDGLWISNGAAWGTQQITGIADAATAAQGGLDPTDLTVVGNEVWFEGTDSSGDVGLWETDGTAAGTHELIPGLVASDLTFYDGAVYFVGTDGGLWKTDGTAAGTTEIVGLPTTALGQFSNEPNAPPGGATYNIYTPGAAFPGGFGAGSLDVFNGQLLFGGTVIEENADQTPVWQRLLFSWDGSTLQALGIGPFDDGIANGTNAQGQPTVAYFDSSPGGPGVGSLYTSSSTSNDLLLYGVPNNNYTLINGAGTAGSPLSHSGTWKDELVQTDGTAAGTIISPYNFYGSVVADPTPIDGGLLFEGNLDGINQSSNGELQIESPGFNLFVGATTAPPSFDQVTEQLANSTDYFNDEASGEDTADWSWDLQSGTMPVIPPPPWRVRHLSRSRIDPRPDVR